MKQLHGTDPRTMAFINMFGVLGVLPELCRIDEQASALIADWKISLGMQVTGGPSATLRFDHGGCTMTEGVADCEIRLRFSSPEKFNGMIDGTVTPIPTKGITKVKFLLGPFRKLTDRLAKYLRATEEDLSDPAFFERSTTLMFDVIVSALSQIGNHDRIGRFSASYLSNGAVSLRIQGGPEASVCVRDHLLQTRLGASASPAATMEFANMQIARDLFEGRCNAMACIGVGEIRVNGLIPMLYNVNRLLDRVGLYLA